MHTTSASLKLMRQPCRCTLRQRHTLEYVTCAGCQAWERGYVLLVNGQKIPRHVWLQLQAGPDCVEISRRELRRR